MARAVDLIPPYEKFFVDRGDGQELTSDDAQKIYDLATDVIGRGSGNLVFKVRYNEKDYVLRVSIPVNVATRNKFIKDTETYIKVMNLPHISQYIMPLLYAKAFDKDPGMRDAYQTGENITIYKYIAGKSLNAFNANELYYNDDRISASNIMSQITAALRALHMAGFIHRDIKPENIYITNEGRVYLLDLDQICDLSIPNDCKNLNAELISTPGFARYDNEIRRIRPYDFTIKDDLFAYGKILENKLRTVSKDKKDLIEVVGNRLTFTNKGGRYKKTRRNKMKRRNRKPTRKNRVG